MTELERKCALLRGMLAEAGYAVFFGGAGVSTDSGLIDFRSARDGLYNRPCQYSASPEEIDEINILQATYRAMRKAIAALDPEPDFVLADAVTIPDIAVSQRGIIHGDAKSVSIGAASIIAKVERDAMMDIYGELYPGYGFEKNKGYGSAEHIEALKRLGPCPIHRKSFIKNFVEL